MSCEPVCTLADCELCVVSYELRVVRMDCHAAITVRDFGSVITQLSVY